MINEYYFLYSSILRLITTILPIGLFLLKIVKLHVFEFHSTQAKNLIKVINPISSSYDCTNELPNGYFISTKGIGYIKIVILNNGAPKITLKILTTNNFVESITTPHEEEVNECFLLYNISIKYLNKITWKDEAYYNQKQLINKILKTYDECGFARCFIYGKSGVGKSTIAPLLARQINGILCEGFDLSNKQHHIQHLYDVGERRKKSIIVVIDEVDVFLDNFDKEVKDEEKKTIDKMVWNNFLDSIKKYYHCILIMTSNRSSEEITDDQSLLQTHRVDLLRELL